MEKLAEQLYVAVADLLQDNHITGLLTAVADAKTHTPFNEASDKTRTVFGLLAANLTRVQGGA
jgi:hypothetical protein